MCDSLCAIQPERTIFAKSSDRPPAEPQVVEAWPRRRAGGSLRVQHLGLLDTGAAALLGSRPTWLWGLETGVNEHRVAIGNEQLWTADDPAAQPDALLGMDLVRLGLERARTAEEALDVVTTLLEEHGQGGVGDRDAGKAYFSSFLLADPTEAWALETSARSWAARRVAPGGDGRASVALSNRIALSTDWTRASSDVARAGDFDRWRRRSSPTEHADRRLAVSAPAAAAASLDRDATGAARRLAEVLRHHGTRSWGRPGDDRSVLDPLPPAVVDRSGTGVSLCMHLAGVQATTSSMIASLPRDPDEPMRAWVAPGSPCVTVFVPVFPVDGVAPELADPATWHRFAALRTRVEQARAADPGPGDTAALAAIREVLGPVEAELWEAADEVVERDAERGAWAREVWPAVDAALTGLGV